MRYQSGVATCSLPWRRPEQTLDALVARLNPDLVLPCDEPGLDMVRAIRGNLDAVWPDVSRSQVIDIARSVGVRAPEMQRIEEPADLGRWIDAHGLPVVLKTDRSWGGRGVAVALDREQAVRLWRRLSRGPSILRALKRVIVNADPGPLRDWWRGRRPCVNAQVHVNGRDANVALAVRDGMVLAALAVEVLQTRHTNGPAKLVRVIDHPGMLLASRKIMQRLRLTGLVGIDFILDPDGTAHLIEVNARVTPTCQLACGQSRDPVGALRASFPHPVPPTPIDDAVGQIIDLDALGRLAAPRTRRGATSGEPLCTTPSEWSRPATVRRRCSSNPLK
jgi:hypothetical protein